MNKEQQDQARKAVQKMKLVEPLLKLEGFQLFLDEMRTRRERHVDSAKTNVESHSLVSNRLGRVDALDEVLIWADRVISVGQTAFKSLRMGGDDDDVS